MKRHLAILALLAGCQGATEPSPVLDQLPRALTAAEQTVITSSNRFAFDLYRQLDRAGTGENLVVSPLSVSMAMGMAMNGAATETWAEMRDGLRFEGLAQEEINASYRGLVELLLDLDPAVRMSVANSVWYRREFPFEQTFLETVRTSFDAEVRDLDFGDDRSVVEINDWVRSATGGRIPTILETIGPNDVMYLINAIYFRAKWRNRFDPAATRDDTFRTSGGEEVPVKMMNLEGQFRYGWTPRYQAVDLPYGNGAFTMTIVLPAEGENVSDILTGLDAASWHQLVQNMAEARVMASLPRFKIEYEQTLNDALKGLGIERAFKPGADFTRLSPRGRELFISSVLHKTFIEVDEEGTEAAAATKVTIGIVSAPPHIRVDRPFIFALRERLSGTVLFLGKIERP